MFNLKNESMETSNSFSVLFWLKLSSKKNNQAPLYALITINGKCAEISLKRKITIFHWDASKNRLKNSHKAKIINSLIEKTHHKIFECYQELRSQDKLISSSLLKSVFLGNNSSRYKLSDVIEYHNEYMKTTLL